LEDVCIDKNQLTNILNGSGSNGGGTSPSAPSGEVYANDPNQNTEFASSTQGGQVAGTSTESTSEGVGNETPSPPPAENPPANTPPSNDTVSVGPADTVTPEIN
jgi:hypothetical protein